MASVQFLPALRRPGALAIFGRPLSQERAGPRVQTRPHCPPEHVTDSALRHLTATSPLTTAQGPGPSTLFLLHIRTRESFIDNSIVVTIPSSSLNLWQLTVSCLGVS